MFDLPELLVVVGAALTCAVVACIFLLRSSEIKPTSGTVPSEPMAFLFNDGVLHHASQNALTYFALMPGAHVWDDLRERLLHRFPQFPETVTNETLGSMTMQPQHKHDHGTLTLRWRDSLCWVELAEYTNPSQSSSDTEIAALKVNSDTSPHPAWQTREDGTIGWRNQAYVKLSERCRRSQDDLLFETPTCAGDVRTSLEITPKATEWFSVNSHQTSDGMIHHATCITHLTQAEDIQRTFVQTLAKTFAQLPIGLAIFDRNGQLSIFNPALVDLSDLRPQYLAAKPTILSFFDALRENRRMPEPKNYLTWRNDISSMIAAAADGQYNETWTLEDGRTYTVQGRPHPDGATAFLIEDISGEVTLTRNFRTEVAQYEALLNSVEDALIVFSSGGVVTFSNDAYHKMWGQNPEAAFADVTAQDAVNLWQARTDTDLAKLSEFIKTLGLKDELTVPFIQDGDVLLSAQLNQVGLDATLVRFSKRRAPTETSSTDAKHVTAK